MNQQNPLKWRHFEAEIILLCVRWYLRYSLSHRDLEEMMAERGLSVDHTTIYRWVQQYAPELEKRCRPHLKATTDSWKVDETYIKVRKTWMYLYRAVDSEGNTLEFLLSPTRDAEAAKGFFVKALHATACSAPQEARPVEEQVAQPTALADLHPTTSAPRVINVDKNAAYPKYSRAHMRSSFAGKEHACHLTYGLCLSPGLLKIPEEQSCLATSRGSKDGCPLVLFASTFLHLLPFPSYLQH